MSFAEDNYADLIPADTPADVEMGGEEAVVEIGASGSTAAAAAAALPFQEESMDDPPPPRVSYVDYLKSPIIGLLVGQGVDQALLTAHQALLTTSPWFAEACAQFSADIPVRCAAVSPQEDPANAPA